MLELLKPANIGDLLSILENRKAVIVNGGTDILVRISDGYVPDLMVDIYDIDELKQIRVENGEILIGGSATVTDTISDNRVSELYPGFVQGLLSIGAEQIRNRATIAGNIANASPAADSVPPLLAAEAELFLASSRGTRRIRLRDFFKGPGSTVLEKDEFIQSIILKEKKGKGVFLKMGQRKALAISKVSLALRFDEQYSVAVGAVFKTPLFAEKTSEYVNHSADQPQFMDKAKEILKSECCPISDIRSCDTYRSEMAAYLLETAFKQI